MKINNLTIILTFFFISFILIINTGLHSDDYSALEISKRTSIQDFLSISIYSKGQTLFGIFNHFLFYWAYEFFSINHDYIYDYLKITINIISCLLFYCFSSTYLNRTNSLIFTLFFVFSPLHDSTTYWYMTTPYIFTACIILYCHYLIRNDYIKIGFILLLFSSFLSYSSPPYIFGASLIFLIEKKYNKFIIFIIPGIIYVSLYLIYTYYFPQYENRINENINLIFLFKNFILQFFTSLDSLLGPSSLIKYILSIYHNNIISFILGIIFILFLLKIDFTNKINFSKSLFFGLLFILFLSLCMFSLTGLYFQSPFNLGNRSLIYGSLFLSYLMVLICSYSKLRFLIIVFYILSVFGLSQFWKDINKEQKIIIENISNNPFLEIDNNSTLFVENNLYFELGLISHVEFFTAPWVLESIFKSKNKNLFNLSALKKHIEIYDGYILDVKTQKKIKLGNSIYLYDSSTNKIKKISKKELLLIIDNKEIQIRHWVQLIRVDLLRDIIINLSPRLEIYFYEN